MVSPPCPACVEPLPGDAGRTRFVYARIHPRESETGPPWPTFHDSQRSSLIGMAAITNTLGKQPSMAPGTGPAVLGRSLGLARDATGIA